MGLKWVVVSKIMKPSKPATCLLRKRRPMIGIGGERGHTADGVVLALHYPDHYIKDGAVFILCL